MKTICKKALLFLPLWGLMMLAPHINAQTKNTKDGFTRLFNGNNLDGWVLKIRNGDSVLAKKVFAAGDGVVHVFKGFPDGFDSKPGDADTHGMMFTKKKYSMYIFRFEYRWGKARVNNFSQYQYDAGMFYHVYDDQIWPKGIEYQVRFDHTKNKNHTGDIYASGTSFQWYSRDSLTFALPKQGGKPMPVKKGEHLAAKDAEFHALDNQWNQCEVIVMGNKYAIQKLNGKIVNMATGLSAGEGLIGLQAETAEIVYRNMMIKEFRKSVPLEKFLKQSQSNGSDAFILFE
jgi:hypothetical protein